MTSAEQVTAATDLLLSLFVVGGVAWLGRVTMASGARRLWFAGLLAFAIAGILGFIVHGFTWPAATRTLLWQPLYLLLGTALAFMVAGGIADWRGYPAGRRALPFLLLVAFGFYLATRMLGGKYVVFVVFQGLAIIALLAIYARVSFAHRRPGSGWMLAGFIISLLGGIAQAMNNLEVRVIVPFDHNGIYHVIQMAGVGCLLVGLRELLGRRNGGQAVRRPGGH